MVVKKEITTINDCYKYSYKEIEQIDIINERKKKGFLSKRSSFSYICEIKTHKFLYHLGIQQKRTKDADLEEEITSMRNLIYMIIGGIL